ncbi:EAL domain-containing protein [Frankia casuarinae]|uniref:Diguanylate phosphodiesterase (EAL domain) with GAF sensor n=2 Tax=Frankia casuarinae (strain DSM 45818 / CECT 9043 / HFP020203 / CcI3) TaxID=106370 RepID=Q2JB31_FRACC|nr:MULTISPECIES: EAL domain-containing protein [Frankia]ABD11511.1 diguanylate phosphodiesterase (EAL domain) with GAF sensor [Frankia casuarinae]ETA00124.1 EAL domain-containing protein [Frankia sp. CcI6]EYT90282.1 EAL domain-containing protein [Frankia casuarinae]KDA41110.1 EAL domain-containing protein [Frankia sp. BMG5.23]KFB02810.1 EAL domain-containing protein [Frankia sp. Allo2]
MSVRPTPASVLGPKAEVPEPATAVVELLGILRRHLGMDLAWLGRIEADVLVVQVINGDGASFQLAPGSTVRRESALFGRVLSGEFPTVIPDTRADPRILRLPVVDELDVGAYAAVPVVDSDGIVYGLAGCLGHGPHPHLRPRDGRFLRMIAEILGDSVTDLHRMWEVRSRVWRDVSHVIDGGGPALAFQPVLDLEHGKIIGVEALSRFSDYARSPSQWFTAAGSVGLNVDLELAAVRRALAVLPRLPTHMILAINVSATTLSAGLVDMIMNEDAERILVEITEHERIGDTPAINRDIEHLRRLGVRIAADDVGTGYAGLEQLVRLRPEIIKMDCCLTQGIDTDPARRAVAAGLVHVAKEIGGSVVAEGIETAAELQATRETAIPYGQGFLLGPPTPVLPEAVR